MCVREFALVRASCTWKGTHLKNEKEDGHEPREPMLRIVRHPEDVEEHRPSKKVGELQKCFPRRVNGTRHFCTRVWKTPTACKDWIASELSCARTPKRKIGKLYTGAENRLVTNDIA